MRLIQKMCRQAAVYWPPSSGMGDDGQPIPSDPIEVKCRWEDINEVFVDASGRTATSKSKVYLLVDINPDGGYLWLSSLKSSAVGSGAVLAELTDPTSPSKNENAWEIRAFSKIPDRKATDFLRYAML